MSGRKLELTEEGMKLLKRVSGDQWQFKKVKYYKGINTVVPEPESSKPLIPNPASGHDPEPVPSISHIYNKYP
jgi:hypothetical protein